MTSQLTPLLTRMRHCARAQRLSDHAWAVSAGLRPETLARLANRSDCDLNTLNALGSVVGLRMQAVPIAAPVLPAVFGRAEEQALLDLCASGSADVRHWLAGGPRWFMAGVAMLMARGTGPQRKNMALLAEALCPGMSTVESFNQWLLLSPVKPTRFLAMLEHRRRVPSAA